MATSGTNPGRGGAFACVNTDEIIHRKYIEARIDEPPYLVRKHVGVNHMFGDLGTDLVVVHDGNTYRRPQHPSNDTSPHAPHSLFASADDRLTLKLSMGL